MITVTYRIHNNGKPSRLAPPVVKEFQNTEERFLWEKSQEHPYIQLVPDIVTDSEAQPDE